MRKTRDEYEKYLNEIYAGQDLSEESNRWSYMRGKGLLRKGKLGTALRKYDKIAFNVGFNEWE
jgi:hypothetical protein